MSGGKGTRRASEVAWFAFQELTSSEFAHELSVSRGHSSSNSHNVGTAFDRQAFKGIVIHIHAVSPGRNCAAIERIIHNEVGIAAELDRAFARKKAKELC